METWHKIPGYSLYEASTLGNLRSLNYKRTGRVQMLKPALSTDGYLRTMLMGDDRRYHTITVHRMVCIAFHGPKLAGMEINHMNGIKTDNRPENLEYCTRSQNCKHSFDIGLQKPKRGILNGNSKLLDADVINIRRIAMYGGRYYGRKQLAEKYGVSEAHIKDIVNGRRGIWSHL